MRIRVNFERPEEVCYIGHVDLTRAISRGLRRSGLPLQFTEGFNERVKVEMGFPLSVGMIGEDEYFDFYIEGQADTAHVLEALNKAFKNIIHIKRVREVPFNAPSITSMDAILVHFVYGTAGKNESEEHLEDVLGSILKKDSIVVKRKSKGKIKEKDVREFIKELKVLKFEKDGEVVVLASILFTKHGSIKIDELEKIINGHGARIEFDYVVRKKTLLINGKRMFSPWEV